MIIYSKIEESFYKKLLLNSITNDKGCILWNGTYVGKDYGQISINGVMYYIHKLVAKLFLKDYSDNLNTLHKCDTLRCFNPEHLFMGTQQQNIQDAILKGRRESGFGLFQSRKTHCPSGHEYTKENIIVNKQGYRQCKLCKNINKMIARL